VLAEVVHDADVGMIERRCGAFALETLESVWTVPSVGEELQRHSTAEVPVLGLVDHPHASPSQLGEDAVVRNNLANHGNPSVSEATVNGCEMVTDSSGKVQVAYGNANG
jgi:hypothetical protein